MCIIKKTNLKSHTEAASFVRSPTSKTTRLKSEGRERMAYVHCVNVCSKKGTCQNALHALIHSSLWLYEGVIYHYLHFTKLKSSVLMERLSLMYTFGKFLNT